MSGGAKVYAGAVPLTMVRLVDKSYRNVFEGETVTAESVEPEDLKRLVRKGFLVAKKEDAGEPDTGSGSGGGSGSGSDEFDEAKLGTANVADTMKWVGADKDRAGKALVAEQAKGADARDGLVKKLQAIVGDGS